MLGCFSWLIVLVSLGWLGASQDGLRVVWVSCDVYFVNLPDLFLVGENLTGELATAILELLHLQAGSGT